MKKTALIICLLGDPEISPSSEELSGGFNLDIFEMIEELKKHSETYIIITNTSSFKQGIYKRISDNIELYRITIDEKLLYNQNGFIDNISYIIGETENIIKKINNKISFIHSFYWLSGYVAMQLSQKLGIPFIHTTVSLSADKLNVDVVPKCREQNNWEKAFLPCAKTILAITNEEKETLINDYKISKDKIFVVGRPVNNIYEQFTNIREHLSRSNVQSKVFQENLISDLSNYNAAWWNSGSYLYIGRIVPIKGVDKIILAWYELYKKFTYKTPPLWIVGGTIFEIENLRKNIKEQIFNLEVLESNQKICWWSYLPPASISTLLQRSAVVIEHSKFEAGGRVIIEAMSTKTPVIATPYGFAKDLITDWNNGFIVDYNDIEALAHRMSHFILQPIISKTLGNSAYLTYNNHLKLWAYWDTILNIYNDLFSNGKLLLTKKLEKDYHINYFNKGLIESYPYKTINQKIIENYIKSKYNCSFFQEIINNDGKSFLSKCTIDKDNFILKQFFSICNNNKIWNPYIENNVIAASERLERTVISTLSPSVEDVYLYEKSYSIIALSEKEKEEQGAIEIHELIELISDFNNTSLLWILPQHTSLYCFLFSQKTNNSFKGFCTELIMILDKGWYGSNKNIKKILHKLCEGHTDVAENVINYGKSIITHVINDNNKIKLLPSGDIFYGEKGFDIGLFLSEYLLKNTYAENIADIIEIIHELTSLSKKKIISWCLLMCIRKYIEDLALYPKMTNQRNLFIINELAEYIKV